MESNKFNIAVLPLQGKLFRFALSIIKNDANAKDALQEVLIKLWELRERLNKYNSIEAFAMRMMKNHCIDRLRKNKHTIDISDDVMGAYNLTPEKLATLKDESNLAFRIIEQLPYTQQMIIRLKDVEEYDFDEIADIMEMAAGAVRTNLSRARQAVREQMLKTVSFGAQIKT